MVSHFASIIIAVVTVLPAWRIDWTYKTNDHHVKRAIIGQESFLLGRSSSLVKEKQTYML